MNPWRRCEFAPSGRQSHRTARDCSGDHASVFGLDSLSVSDLSLIDPERKSTIRVGAGPRLKRYGRAFLAIIRQRDQETVIALLAFRQFHLRTSFRLSTGMPVESL